MTEENIQNQLASEPQTPRDGDNNWARWACYLGVVAFLAGCCILVRNIWFLIPGLLLGPVAVVLGIQGIRYCSKHRTAGGRTSALAGIALGVLATLVNGGLICLMVIARSLVGGGAWK